MADLEYIFNRYVVEPLYADTGYNVVNTLLYAAVFILAIYVIHRELFLKGRLKLNERFAASLSGWMVLGGVLRVLKDAGSLNSLLFVSPFIYALLFFAVVVAVTIFQALERHKFLADSNRALLFTGWALALIALSYLRFKNLAGMISAVALWILLGILLFLISTRSRFLAEKWNFFALQSQLLDACGSFVGITYYGFWEKHVLGRSLMNLLESKNLLLINGSAAWIMIALKLIFVPLALWLVDKHSKDETEARFVKLIIIILGIGIGTRNVLAVGVFG